MSVDSGIAASRDRADSLRERLRSTDAWLHELRASFLGDGTPLDKCKTVLGEHEYAMLCALLFVDIFYVVTPADTERARAIQEKRASRAPLPSQRPPVVVAKDQ